jgi:hypothetical protein
MLGDHAKPLGGNIRLLVCAQPEPPPEGRPGHSLKNRIERAHALEYSVIQAAGPARRALDIEHNRARGQKAGSKTPGHAIEDITCD